MYKNKEKHPELWHDIENIWEGFIHSINIENNVS